jgi:hypothetical protein
VKLPSLNPPGLLLLYVGIVALAAIDSESGLRTLDTVAQISLSVHRFAEILLLLTFAIFFGILSWLGLRHLRRVRQDAKHLQSDGQSQAIVRQMFGELELDSQMQSKLRLAAVAQLQHVMIMLVIETSYILRLVLVLLEAVGYFLYDEGSPDSLCVNLCDCGGGSQFFTHVLSKVSFIILIVYGFSDGIATMVCAYCLTLPARE